MKDKIQNEKDRLVSSVLDSHYSDLAKLQIITDNELWPMHPFTLDPLRKEERASIRVKEVKGDRDKDRYLCYLEVYLMFHNLKENAHIKYIDMIESIPKISSSTLTSGRKKMKLIIIDNIEEKIIRFALANKKVGFILN